MRDAPLRVDLAGTILDQQTAGFITGQDAYRDEALSRSNPNPEAYRKAHALRLTGCSAPAHDERDAVRVSPVSAQLADGVPAALPAREAGRGKRAGKPRAHEQPDLGQRPRLVAHRRRRPRAGGQLPARVPGRTDHRRSRHQPTRSARPDDTTITKSPRTWRQPTRRPRGRCRPAGRSPAGLRAEYVRYDYDNRMLAGNTDENGVPCGTTGCLYSRPADRDDSFDALAPKLGAVVHDQRRCRRLCVRLAWLSSARDDRAVPPAAPAEHRRPRLRAARRARARRQGRARARCGSRSPHSTWTSAT